MESRKEISDDRTKIASYQFKELLSEIALAAHPNLKDISAKEDRDHSLHALEAARKSGYYKFIQEKLNKDEVLLDDEIFYYVMAANNVSELDQQIFVKLAAVENKYKTNKWWKDTLSVVLRAHQWKAERDLTKNKSLDFHLSQEFKIRGKYCYTEDRVQYFLNMRGFDFTGANLTGVNLDFMDLTCANFSNTTLDDVTIKQSCIRYATFMEARAKSVNNKSNCFSLSLSYTDAQNASFENATLLHPYFSNTDLTDANFKRAIVKQATFKNAKLDAADFSYSTISITNIMDSFSMKKANLAHCQISHFPLHDNYIAGATFLSQNAFSSVADLKLALNISSESLKDFTANKDDAYKEYQTKQFKKLIAAQIAALPNENPLKQTLIDTALAHPLFQTETAIQNWINTAYNAAAALPFTLFGGSNQQSTETNALQILQDARARFPAPRTTMAR